MPETKEITFQFAIGDLLTTKAMYSLNPEACQAFTVVERLAQECYAAVQIQYGLRPVSPPKTWHEGTMATEYNPGTRSLSEPELMPFPDESRGTYRESIRQSRETVETAVAKVEVAL